MNTETAISPKYPVLDDIEIPEDILSSWQVTVDLLAEVAGIPAALIMRVHEQEIEVFRSSHSQGNVYKPGEKAPLNSGLYCETVMSTQRKLLVPNALKDPVWDHNPDIKLGMISYCGLPLTWPNGELFGTICILDKKENSYTPQTHHLFECLRDSIQLSLQQVYHSAIERREAAIHEQEISRSKIEAVHQEWLQSFDAVPDPIFMHDRQFNVLRANKAYANKAGLAFKQFIGRPYWEVFPKLEGPLSGSVDAVKHPQPGVFHDQEFQLETGEIYLSRSSHAFDQNGEYLYSIHFLHDITEAKLAGTRENEHRTLSDRNHEHRICCHRH
ncbi:MAG: PAS domain S-box protein [Betaproteobacteria bacterium]|nr:PAS domain S-box protein [Betaproteobacteria bacterium]